MEGEINSDNVKEDTHGIGTNKAIVIVEEEDHELLNQRQQQRR